MSLASYKLCLWSVLSDVGFAEFADIALPADWGQLNMPADVGLPSVLDRQVLRGRTKETVSRLGARILKALRREIDVDRGIETQK
jgi:hypothetical protein